MNGASCAPAASARLLGRDPRERPQQRAHREERVASSRTPRSASRAAGSRARSVFSSAISRDLPMPGSPTSSTSWNCRMRAASTRLAQRLRAPSSRPTSGSCSTACSRTPVGAPTRVGDDRPVLALDEERLVRGLEARARALEHVRRGEDRARLRPAGQPRGEVDGVAHDRVGAARDGADVAGERGTAVHARAQRQPRRRLEDRLAAPAASAPRPRRRSSARRRRGRACRRSTSTSDSSQVTPSSAAASDTDRPSSSSSWKTASAPSSREQPVDAGELQERDRHRAGARPPRPRARGACAAARG